MQHATVTESFNELRYWALGCWRSSSSSISHSVYFWSRVINFTHSAKTASLQPCYSKYLFRRWLCATKLVVKNGKLCMDSRGNATYDIWITDATQLYDTRWVGRNTVLIIARSNSIFRSLIWWNGATRVCGVRIARFSGRRFCLPKRWI